MKISELSPEQFIRVWQSSRSVEEVAEKTGFPPNTCYQRSLRYRKAGIPLKKFHKGHVTHLDIEALAKLARELGEDK